MEKRRRLYRIFGEIGIWTVVFVFIIYLNFFESLTPCEATSRVKLIGAVIYFVVDGLIVGLNFLD